MRPRAGADGRGGCPAPGLLLVLPVPAHRCHQQLQSNALPQRLPFACAIRAKCMFFKDKTMLCPMHKIKGPCEQELSSFAVFRRVYIGGMR